MICFVRIEVAAREEGPEILQENCLSRIMGKTWCFAIFIPPNALVSHVLCQQCAGLNKVRILLAETKLLARWRCVENVVTPHVVKFFHHDMLISIENGAFLLPGINHGNFHGIWTPSIFLFKLLHEFEQLDSSRMPVWSALDDGRGLALLPRIKTISHIIKLYYKILECLSI